MAARAGQPPKPANRQSNQLTNYPTTYRLIQQQQVGLLQADHREHNAALLPVGQHADLSRLHLARDAVLACRFELKQTRSVQCSDTGSS